MSEMLQRNHPKSMLLLMQIARRARFAEEPCPVTGLEHGQAMIGDYEAAGLTRQEYRTSIRTLTALQLITIKTTTKGTIACMSINDYESTVFSISEHSLQPSKEPTDQPTNNQRVTNAQPLKNKDKKEEVKEEELPLPFNSLRFSQSWESWVSFRKERKKPLTRTMISSTFKNLAKFGEQSAIDAIECSISNGYTGLFPKESKSMPIRNKELTSDQVGMS